MKWVVLLFFSFPPALLPALSAARPDWDERGRGSAASPPLPSRLRGEDAAALPSPRLPLVPFPGLVTHRHSAEESGDGRAQEARAGRCAALTGRR